MSICCYLANLLSDVSLLLGDRGRKQVLTLGVQTCKFDYGTIEKLLQRRRFPYTPLPSEATEKTTGFFADHMLRNYIHQRTFFQMLGFSRENIRAMDASAYEGAEFVHDLNQPVPGALTQSFDLILDAGTIEHVYSTKDAMFAIAQMCRLGGLVVHDSPVDLINHGFVNYNVRFFYNFYLANGFEAVAMKYLVIPRDETVASRYYMEIEPNEYRDAPGPYYDTHIFCVLRKMSHVPPVIPQQENFVRAWESAAKQTSDGSRQRGRMRRLLVSALETSYLGSSLTHVIRTMKYARKRNL